METWEPTLFNLGYSYRKLRCVESVVVVRVPVFELDAVSIH